jgi:site-specific DNA recombinase
MDVVGYCRFSSEGQRDGYSVEAQVRAITEWAAREGHTIRKFYIDEAKTGTNDNREDFQQMIADAAGGTFKAVVVHKLDRFARDRYDSAVYRHKLKQYGIRVISVLEPLDDSPESVMMEAVLEGMAEYYSRNLSREVRKGKKEAALLAHHNGGPVPYGYTVNDKMEYEIVPEEAAIIREIFRQLDGGATYSAVAKWAVGRGLKTKRGTFFSEPFIAHLVSNTMLAGQFTYGLRSRVGQEPIILDGAVPAIVDANVFWRVHNKAKERKRGPRSRLKEDDYILTGYLFCAYCGSHLYGFKSKKTYKSAKGADRLYEARFYRCAVKTRTSIIAAMSRISIPSAAFYALFVKNC